MHTASFQHWGTFCVTHSLVSLSVVHVFKVICQCWGQPTPEWSCRHQTHKHSVVEYASYPIRLQSGHWHFYSSSSRVWLTISQQQKYFRSKNAHNLLNVSLNLIMLSFTTSPITHYRCVLLLLPFFFFFTWYSYCLLILSITVLCSERKFNLQVSRERNIWECIRTDIKGVW